jgi:hypothetical protein
MNDDTRMPELADGLSLPARFTDRPVGPFAHGVEVTLAEPEDIDQLSRVIAAAFHDLSASRFLIPDEDDRRKMYPEFFKLVYVKPGVMNGVVHRTADSLACAVWLPMGDAAGWGCWRSGANGDRAGRVMC